MSFMGGVSQKNILEVEANKRINQMFFFSNIQMKKKTTVSEKLSENRLMTRFANLSFSAPSLHQFNGGSGTLNLLC